MTTQKFEFVNYNVDLDIAGQSFTMDCSSETGDYCETHKEYENNRAVHAIANIERCYDDRLKNNDFA